MTEEVVLHMDCIHVGEPMHVPAKDSTLTLYKGGLVLVAPCQTYPAPWLDRTPVTNPGLLAIIEASPVLLDPDVRDYLDARKGVDQWS